ncbi:cytochrome c oxidase copper chaperone [Pseudophryne corroboree]|uniref:cytochrome c oxidase copper chaperone n=1 Tax=Pseudophryne corroboree TaxID=495146 RepID=UPI003081B1DE
MTTNARTCDDVMGGRPTPEAASGAGERDPHVYGGGYIVRVLCAGKPYGPTMSSLTAASCESAPVSSQNHEKKPLRPCCACPETKKARDACIIQKGEERCREMIEAHKKCMRSLGFKV